jgi:hypothetical protein
VTALLTASTDSPPAARTDTVRTVPFGRKAAVAGLVVGSVLNLAEALLAQALGDKPESSEERLQVIAENTTLYGVRTVVGTLAVPFLLLALLSAARLLAPRARRTAGAAAALVTAGMWGFLGLHLLMLNDIALATGGDLAGDAAVLDRLQENPWVGVLVILPFLVGTALGLLLLVVGLLRTGAVARWIPAVWGLFLVLDFGVQSGVGPVDPHWLFVAGAFGLAAHVRRTSDREWANA